MPTALDGPNLDANIRNANFLAGLQPGLLSGARATAQSLFKDPVQSGISPKDLAVLKEKCPNLSEFSDEFLQGRTLDELLRIESTSLRIKDAERARETEDRLSSNKAAMLDRFFEVEPGKDNRSTELHPARFLPGMACSAVSQFIAARKVLGLSSPPALGCYDMTSIGMGGHIVSKGWLELGTMGSCKLKVTYFNINNASRSSINKSQDGEDKEEMRDVSEFIRAIRTLRAAAQLVVPWNLSFLALDNYLFDKEYFKEDLKHDPNPAKTLCRFTDFCLAENANKYRDGNGFLTYGDLAGYWTSFIGARPVNRPSASNSNPSPVSLQQRQGVQKLKDLSRKRKYPFSGICNKFNTNNCNKIPGSCFSFRGEKLLHVCNWRDPNVPNAQPCGQAHMRVVAH